MIDIHSHLLPGIDDGPRTWEQSIALCRAVADEGVTLSIATPHLIDGIYENTLERVRDLTEELVARLNTEGIALEVRAGAEVDFSSRYLVENTEKLPTLGGGRAVLLEMPVAVIPPALKETIFALRARNLLPVIAHPERNELLQDDPTLARAWCDVGAVLQLDGDSLLGVWGRRSKRCAEALLRARSFQAMASDAHSVEKRPPRVRAAIEAAGAIVGEETAQWLVTDGPRSLLQGAQLDPPLVATGSTGSEQSRSKGSGFFGRLFRRDH